MNKFEKLSTAVNVLQSTILLYKFLYRFLKKKWIKMKVKKVNFL